MVDASVLVGTTGGVAGGLFSLVGVLSLPVLIILVISIGGAILTLLDAWGFFDVYSKRKRIIYTALSTIFWPFFLIGKRIGWIKYKPVAQFEYVQFE